MNPFQAIMAVFYVGMAGNFAELAGGYLMGELEGGFCNAKVAKFFGPSRILSGLRGLRWFRKHSEDAKLCVFSHIALGSLHPSTHEMQKTTPLRPLRDL